MPFLECISKVLENRYLEILECLKMEFKNSGFQPIFLPQHTWKKGDNLTVAFYKAKKG